MQQTYWMFEDKSEDLEFTKQGDAVEYKPWGLVTCIQYPEDREDGNVIGVLYRSPTGRLFRRWRQTHEIVMKEIDMDEWKRVHEILMFAGEASDDEIIQANKISETSKLLH